MPPGAGAAEADEADRLCAALLRDRLATELDLHEADEDLRPLRIIGSPVSSIRSVFDLMPTATADNGRSSPRGWRRCPTR